MNHKSSKVVCPFYKRQEACKIVCEGVLECTTIHTVFRTSEQLTDHQTKYCTDVKRCSRCVLYNAIMARYQK